MLSDGYSTGLEVLYLSQKSAACFSSHRIFKYYYAGIDAYLNADCEAESKPGIALLFEIVPCFEVHILESLLNWFINELPPLSCVQACLKPTLQLSTVKGLLSKEPHWFANKLLWHYTFTLTSNTFISHGYLTWKTLVLLSALEQSNSFTCLHSKWQYM